MLLDTCTSRDARRRRRSFASSRISSARCNSCTTSALPPKVADKFLACGVLEHGFARVRCDACAHEYLLAFSCKARYFCPSCHAKRLALWTLWLEETLLAAVPHRQVVLTIPKRLRTWCLYRRAILQPLARLHGRHAGWETLVICGGPLPAIVAECVIPFTVIIRIRATSS